MSEAYAVNPTGKVDGLAASDIAFRDHIGARRSGCRYDRGSRARSPLSEWPRKTFAFFTRTSLELCDAIVDKTRANRGVVIRRQLARMTTPRLRCAFEAASELECWSFSRAIAQKTLARRSLERVTA